MNSRAARRIKELINGRAFRDSARSRNFAQKRPLRNYSPFLARKRLFAAAHVRIVSSEMRSERRSHSPMNGDGRGNQEFRNKSEYQKAYYDSLASVPRESIFWKAY